MKTIFSKVLVGLTLALALPTLSLAGAKNISYGNVTLTKKSNTEVDAVWNIDLKDWPIKQYNLTFHLNNDSSVSCESNGLIFPSPFGTTTVCNTFKNISLFSYGTRPFEIFVELNDHTHGWAIDKELPKIGSSLHYQMIDFGG